MYNFLVKGKLIIKSNLLWGVVGWKNIKILIIKFLMYVKILNCIRNWRFISIFFRLLYFILLDLIVCINYLIIYLNFRFNVLFLFKLENWGM